VHVGERRSKLFAGLLKRRAWHASQEASRLIGFADALFFVIAKTALIGDIVSARHRHRRLNLYKPDQLPALRT
jgi:predicted nucleic acid-binding protein